MKRSMVQGTGWLALVAGVLLWTVTPDAGAASVPGGGDACIGSLDLNTDMGECSGCMGNISASIMSDPGCSVGCQWSVSWTYTCPSETAAASAMGTLECGGFDRHKIVCPETGGSAAWMGAALVCSNCN